MRTCFFDAMKVKDLPGMADVDASMLYFCSLVKRRIRLLLQENVPTRFSAVIRGFIVRICLWGTAFRGLKIFQ